MNHYPQVIDVLLDDSTDFRAIVIAIAKKHPKLVLDSMPKDPEPEWLREVDAHLASDAPGRKISAIKLWRAHTGAMLKEAKEAVEARQAAKGFI